MLIDALYPNSISPFNNILDCKCCVLAVNEDLGFGSFPDLNPILTYAHYKSFFFPNT